MHPAGLSAIGHPKIAQHATGGIRIAAKIESSERKKCNSKVERPNEHWIHTDEFEERSSTPRVPVWGSDGQLVLAASRRDQNLGFLIGVLNQPTPRLFVAWTNVGYLRRESPEHEIHGAQPLVPVT